MNTLSVNDSTATRFAFYAYESAGKGMIAGSRQVPVTFKTDKASGVKRPSVAVNLPPVSKEFVVNGINNGTLIEAMRAWCEEAQDKIVREAVIAGAACIEADSLNAEAIAAFMREAMASGRLSAEILGNWYADTMEAPLVLVLAERMGVTEDSPEAKQKQLLAVAEVYKKHVISLASGRTKLSKDESQKLLRAFEVVGLARDAGDEIADKLITKLLVMVQSPDAVDMMAL